MRRPGHFLGKSVKFTAKVKTADVISGTANLWFRVDGKNKKVLAFDNMYDRPITGTTGWKKYSIVLDVPEDAQRLAYGIFVEGEGKAWMKDFTLVEERILELDEMEDDDDDEEVGFRGYRLGECLDRCPVPGRWCRYSCHHPTTTKRL